MERQPFTESNPRYRVLIDSLVTEGRVFQRGDVLTAEDAPGEIESLLHAGIIERVGEAVSASDAQLM